MFKLRHFGVAQRSEAYREVFEIIRSRQAQTDENFDHILVWYKLRDNHLILFSNF